MTVLNSEQRMVELKRKAAEAVERCKLLDKYVATLNGEPATAGDVVLLSKRLGLRSTNTKDTFQFDRHSLFFVLVKTHPDDDKCWYAVPCDDAPFVGPGDVDISCSVRHRHFWPMVVRPSCGIWLDACPTGHSLRRRPFRDTKRCGRLTEGNVGRVVEMLADIARCGGLPSTPEQKETAWDPGYDEHMDRLRRDVVLFEMDELGDADTDHNIEFEE